MTGEPGGRRDARKAAASEEGPRVRPLVLWSQRRVVNPMARRTAAFTPGAAVIETTGRNSGLPRRTPVGGALDGSTFWWVSEFGRLSQYVRNIEADPRVRVQVKGRWYAGTATPVDDDDPRERLKLLPKANSAVVRLFGTNLLTMRIDLDPEPAPDAAPGAAPASDAAPAPGAAPGAAPEADAD